MKPAIVGISATILIACACALHAATATVDPSTDLATLNAELAAMSRAGGGQLYMQAGTYAVDEPIRVPDNVALRGDGPATVLVASPRFDRWLSDRDVYGGASDVAVFFSPQTNYAGIIDVDGSANVTVMDLSVRGNRENVRAITGIMLANARDAVVQRVRVENCGNSGIAVLDSRDVSIDHVTARRNHNGIHVRGTRERTANISVTNCRLEDNRWSGVYVCGAGAGRGVITNGPRNILVSNNFVFRHMCDVGIKVFGAEDVIVTGNRVDWALEGAISVTYSTSFVVNGNICSHGDDGMNNKGNGGGVSYGGPPDGTPINAVIQGNVCREGNNAIWSEDFWIDENGKHQPKGSVAIIGNVCVDNVTAGIGQVMKTDLTCIGNVCVNNGHSLPEPGSPAEDTFGIMLGGGTARNIVLGNVSSDTRPAAKRRMESALILRGCDESIVANNYLTGSKELNIRRQAPGTNTLETGNVDGSLYPRGE